MPTPNTQHFRGGVLAQKVRGIDRIDMKPIVLGKQFAVFGKHLQHLAPHVALATKKSHKHHLRRTGG